MTRQIRTVDVTNNGVTTQVGLVVDRNANNEEAIARAIQFEEALVTKANPLPVLPPAVTTGVAGQTTVTTAGTFVALGTGALTRGVNVRALFANTGIIRVRYTGNATTTGYELGAGDFIWLEADNLSRIQVDAAVSGNGVSYIGS
jgi:hypothetical protein